MLITVAVVFSVVFVVDDEAVAAVDVITAAIAVSGHFNELFDGFWTSGKMLI